MRLRVMQSTGFLLFLGVLLLGQVWATDYQVDPSHSNIGFSIKHMFTNIGGQFTDFKGTFSMDDTNSVIRNISFSIKPSSINTNNAKRDGHLKSPDFFDVAKYPEITFVGRAGKNPTGSYEFGGNLTLHGVTKQVIFQGELLGSGKTPFGQDVVSFTAHAKIDRKDFGLVWNKVLDNGGIMVGNDVVITVDIEASPILKVASPK